MRIIRLLAAGALHALFTYLVAQCAGVDGVQIAIAPMIGAAAIMGGASLLGSYLGKSDIEQQPLETLEQKQARMALMQFANTGKWGDFTAGEEVKGMGYGDYRMTDAEQVGLTDLQKLLREGTPEQYGWGNEALKGILDDSQAGIDAQFNPFKAKVQRQIADSEAALKRSAGAMGGLYSTNTIRELGDVQARGNETLSAELARLTNEALNRRMQAIPLAYNAAESQQGSALQRVSASQTLGALTRNLNDASIKARDAELLRRRQELQLPIQALGQVVGTPSQFGVPSVSTSPYQDLLKQVGQLGGQYFGNQMFLNQAAAMRPTGYSAYDPNYATPYPSSGMGPSWNG